MNSQLPTMQEAAQEAEFQLLAAKDLLEWQYAPTSAIHLDHLHGDGKSAGALAELAKYFSDTGFGGVYSAIDQFKQLGESEAAPQNQQPENVARIPLANFSSGQHAAVAKRLGMTQGSLSKAIREGRVIFVTETAAGELLAVEEKPFPGQRRDVEAAQ
ncbi:Cro/CI family transcriptional regulator [Pseudomonas jessenii]|uniref:Cro protein n=1 Tax=Pseudomonas jessenii TaxID=77298 RepID=A0A370SWN7_PSEJE|nr:Cro/CI family transcriptional regulator [Pseudomonas jessenii]RDL24145.1 Cro protein [Pseudomonas jessenii]